MLSLKVNIGHKIFAESLRFGERAGARVLARSRAGTVFIYFCIFIKILILFFSSILLKLSDFTVKALTYCIVDFVVVVVKSSMYVCLRKGSEMC